MTSLPLHLIFENICSKIPKNEYKTIVSTLIALGKEYIHDIDRLLFGDSIRIGNIVWIKDNNLFLIISKVTDKLIYLDQLSLEYIMVDNKFAMCRPEYPLRPMRQMDYAFINKIKSVYNKKHHYKQLKAIESMYRLKYMTRFPLKRLKRGLLKHDVAAIKWLISEKISFQIFVSFEEIHQFRKLDYIPDKLLPDL